MKLHGVLTATFALALAACSALFEEPVQCANDGDCAKFQNAVCGSSGTCETRGAEGLPDNITPGGPGGTTPEGTTTPQGTEPTNPNGNPTPGPVACPNLEVRPQAAFPGVVAGATEAELSVDTNITCASTFVLSGVLVVRSKLTIGAGTWIRAEAGAALVIAPGGQIIANGEKDRPIVFTSAKAANAAAGDWNGIALLGNAPPTGNVNGVDYGGNVENDSSGSLKYVRVEYAARGLTFMSVGSGTAVDFVQVRKTTTDNCFTFSGGRVDVKHLVCQYPGDEMFEFNSGYQGRAQFLIGQRTPVTGGGHHGLMVDNSTVTASNVTLCGAEVDNQGMGLVLRNNAAPTITNAVVRGFNVGLDVVNARGTPFELKSSVLQGNRTDNVATIEDSTDTASPAFDDDQGFDERAFFSDAARKNVEVDPGFACFDANNPSFAPGSAIAGDAPPAGFFDVNAAFAGAVRDGANDWTKDAWLLWSSN